MALGDPRFLTLPGGKGQEIRAVLPQLVNVPAGKFRIGTNEEDEKLQNTKYCHDQKPSHIVHISEFSIGKYPVTNLEYRSFYEAKGYENREYWSNDGWNWRTGKWDTDLSWMFEDLQSYKDWLESRPVELRKKPFFWENSQWNAPNLPVVGITWFESEAYCKWLSHITGKNYRLPTEAEWEKAARGTNNSMWPWGNIWNGDLCNTAGENTKEKLNCTSPVGMYPNGASDYGVLDMIGNIWEWCNDWYDANEYKSRTNNTVNDPQGPQNGKTRVVRGSSFFETDESIHCASRGQTGPEYFSSVNGFRVCISHISQSEP